MAHAVAALRVSARRALCRGAPRRALRVDWHFGQAEREREGGVLPNIQAVMLLKKTETSDKA